MGPHQAQDPTVQNPTMLAPGSQASRLQNEEGQTSVVNELPSLWCFVTAGSTD